jgi:hypothetical protein
VCSGTDRIHPSPRLDPSAEFWTLPGKEANLSFVFPHEDHIMYAVIGNCLAGLLAISLFTATIRLSK